MHGRGTRTPVSTPRQLRNSWESDATQVAVANWIAGYPSIVYYFRNWLSYLTDDYDNYYLKMITLGDFSTVWELVADSSFGSDFCAADLNDDSIEDVIMFHNNNFSVIDGTNGVMIGISENIPIFYP